VKIVNPGTQMTKPELAAVLTSGLVSLKQQTAVPFCFSRLVSYFRNDETWRANDWPQRRGSIVADGQGAGGSVPPAKWLSVNVSRRPGKSQFSLQRV